LTIVALFPRAVAICCVSSGWRPTDGDPAMIGICRYALQTGLRGVSPWIAHRRRIWACRIGVAGQPADTPARV